MDDFTDLNDIIKKQQKKVTGQQRALQSSVERSTPDIISTSATPAAVIGTEASQNQAIFSNKLFSLSRVQYNLNGQNKITHIVVKNNILVLTLSNNHLQKINLDHPEVIEDYEIKCGPNDLVYRMFLDSSGVHLLVTMISGDLYYFNLNLWRKPRLLSKAKNVTFDCCSFLTSNGTSLSASTNHSTGPILLGTKEGYIYYLEIESSGEDQINFLGAATVVKKEVFKQLFSLRDCSITGIFTFHNATSYNFYVLLTTSNRIYQLSSRITKDLVDIGVVEAFFGRIKSEQQLSYQELPGELPPLTVSELHVLFNPATNLPTIFAWTTAAGIYYGDLVVLEEISDNSTDPNVIDNTQLLPYPVVAPFNEGMDSPSQAENLINFTISQFHFILLYTDRVRIINRLTDEIAHEELLPSDGSFFLISDEIKSTFWIFSADQIHEVLMNNEYEDIWKIFLKRKQYELALEYSSYGAHAEENKNYVYKEMADAYFDQGRFSLASNYYAKSNLISIESVLLKYMKRNSDKTEQQISKMDSLISYLHSKLKMIAGLSNNLYSTQKTIIATLILHLEISKRIQIENTATLKITSPNLVIEGDQTDTLLNLFTNELVVSSLDYNTTSKMLADFGCVNEMIFFALLVEDYTKVINHYIHQKQYAKAIEVLSKASSPDLFYRFSSVLIEKVPVELVDAWVKYAHILVSKELLPAMMKYKFERERDKEHQIIRFLEYTINSNLSSLSEQNNEPDDNLLAVSNYLISLYISSENSEEQFDYSNRLIRLIKLNQSNGFKNIDLYYALRLCVKQKKFNSSVVIYGELGLFEEAVELALSTQDLELAKVYANKISSNVLDAGEFTAQTASENRVKKSLWLRILQFELSTCTQENKSKVIDSVLKDMADLNGLITVEDILSIVSGPEGSGENHAMLLVDDLKEEIISSLKNYKSNIELLKSEMEEAKSGSEELRMVSERMKSRFLVLSQNSKCSVCSGRLFSNPPKKSLAHAPKDSPTGKFLAFPCGHNFHESCCVMYCFENYGKRDHDVEGDCALCGLLTIKSIDRPFVSDEELRSWDI